MGISLFGEGFQPAAMAILPPGGFIILGVILGVINIIKRREKTDA